MKKSTFLTSTALAAALAAVGSPLASAQLSSGLVAYWPMDGDLLDTNPGGLGAHGTFFEGFSDPDLRFADEGNGAKFGQALDLNNVFFGGLDQYVFIESVPENTFDFTGGSMSFSLWAQSSFIAFENHAIMAKGEGASWRFTSNGFELGPAFNAGGVAATGDDLLHDLGDGLIHHYVGVAEDGVGVKLYRDGVLISSVPGPVDLGDNGENLFIGANPEAPALEGFRAWEGLLDDIGIWSRALTSSEVSVLWNNGIGVRIGDAIDDSDSDGDGLPDFFENTNAGLDANNPDDAGFDNDTDGLTNLEEFNLGTDLNNPHSDGDLFDPDGDGINDGDEVNGTLNPFLPAPTDPLLTDSDGDGLDDGEEITGSGNPAFGNAPTNPNLADTDGDGATDTQEIAFGFNPNDPNDSPPPLQRGLKGFWSFDNTLDDGSGLGFDGEMLGTNPTPRYTTGKLGRAILLDGRSGVNQSVQIVGSGSEFDSAGGGVSISAWVRLSIAPNAEPHIVGKGGGDNWRLTMSQSSSELNYYGGGDPISGGGSIAGPIWRHAVAVSEPGVATRLYLDGLLVAVGGPPNLGSNGLPMEIGGNPDLPDMNWNGLVDEVAVWTRALTTGEVRQIWNNGQGITTGDLVAGVDGDGDGMSDIYETNHGLNPAVDDAALDLDGDGLNNKDEHDAGSHPNNPDTDGDGLEDDGEAAAGTNPLGPDSDNDGLTDGEEVNTYNTDPTKKDTDSDGFSDSAELRLGSDPNDAGSVPGISPYVAAVLADEPIVYWQFDESSGDTASDSADMGADGTILGGVTLAAESFHPNLGTAFHFDGASGRIDIPALGVYPKSSIEVWINIEGLAGGCCTSIYSTDTWASGNLHFNLKGGRDVEHAINGGGNNNTSAGLIQNGTWYHVVVTYDTTMAGQTKFYIDGALVTTSAHASANAMNLITGEIGAWAGTRFFNGRMDEFAFYDHILTPEQVQRHFEAATAATAPETRRLPWTLVGDGADLLITWESEAGKSYNLRSETDLLVDPATWAIFGGHENILATPPENTLRIPRPGEEKRFFVIEAFPTPAP